MQNQTVHLIVYDSSDILSIYFLKNILQVNLLSLKASSYMYFKTYHLIELVCSFLSIKLLLSLKTFIK